MPVSSLQPVILGRRYLPIISSTSHVEGNKARTVLTEMVCIAYLDADQEAAQPQPWLILGSLQSFPPALPFPRVHPLLPEVLLPRLRVLATCNLQHIWRLWRMQPRQLHEDVVPPVVLSPVMLPPVPEIMR